jgi:hypothetical protein
VAQAVEPHARRKAPVELGFGSGIDPLAGHRDAAHECGIIECGDVLGHARRITTICMDV